MTMTHPGPFLALHKLYSSVVHFPIPSEPPLPLSSIMLCIVTCVNGDDFDIPSVDVLLGGWVVQPTFDLPHPEATSKKCTNTIISALPKCN